MPSQIPLLLLFMISPLLLAAPPPVSAQLSPEFYETSCPDALSIIGASVRAAVAGDPRVAASLLRLHFHDCFSDREQGCDASVLLDDVAGSFTGEKTAFPNRDSLRGFEVVDVIKASLEVACPLVVSCADILAVAARDAVAALGGPLWTVQLGRRDSTSASLSSTNSDLPSPFSDLNTLISAFAKKGLSIIDMIALSGSHTIGQARCTVFRTRIYSDNNVNSSFASLLRSKCSIFGKDNDLSPLDMSTPTVFDNGYYKNLLSKRGLLHSDQQLYLNESGLVSSRVSLYAKNSTKFFRDFASAMVKMGNIGPLIGENGEIRTNCRKIN
ncbi:cationic peroxidase 1-like [Zingiber officinale]|uniref:cationic peroxidase 1-like n=1 Tax=Zingiber officinale TaxID=94328 RepID=UPI001C4BD023|nr:cationic peroxidase 1-like [Zingiber officinale]